MGQFLKSTIGAGTLLAKSCTVVGPPDGDTHCIVLLAGCVCTTNRAQFYKRSKVACCTADER